ncbi:MAG: hypothetical protein HEEMFOPI_00934 [Holosporales bacterium]
MSVNKIDDYIKAHSDWKIKLQRYLRHPDGSIKAAGLFDDHGCELGKWIFGSVDAKLKSFPEFEKLQKEHRRFHQAAADIVERANRGEQIAEEVVIGSSSAFASASMSVVTLLMNLKRHMNS